MSSFFDEAESDDESSIPLGQPRRSMASNAVASSSRLGAGAGLGAGVGSGSRAFLSRLSTSIAGSPERTYGRVSPDLEDDELEVEEEDVNDNDIKKLGRIWTRERGTVTIMPWEEDAIDSVLNKLEQQQQLCQTLRGDPETSEEEHFKLLLVETEMERAKFLVRGYLRTRLSKIEKYSHHITVTPELHRLLSPSELQHAEKFTALLHQHFSNSVLESLPEWLRKMDDKQGDGVSMISEPDENVPVLVYCLRDCGELAIDRGDVTAFTRGSTHIVKYSLVKVWILRGWLEVL